MYAGYLRQHGRALQSKFRKLAHVREPAAVAPRATGTRNTSQPGYRPALQRSHPVVYHTDFQISPLPDGHRFPMPKDHLLYMALQSEGLANMTFTPSYPDRETLCLTHNSEYVDSFLSGSISQQQMRRIGLPWSEKLVQRTLIGTGSAILAARLALQYGVACMTNGGTHHAHRSHGSGTPCCGGCIQNQCLVAAHGTAVIRR